jgi:hypothetical protein
MKKQIIIHIPVFSTFATSTKPSSTRITSCNKECCAFVHCQHTKLQKKDRERNKKLNVFVSRKENEKKRTQQ